MTTIRTTVMALALITLTTVGAAGLANAAPHGGQMVNNGYGNMTQEQQAVMQKAYDTINPLSQQLYAKQAELNAQIAAGADDKIIQGLVGEVNSLNSKLVEMQASVQRQMVKNGIPANGYMMNCMMGHGGAMHNPNMMGCMMGGGMMGGNMMGGNMMGHNGGGMRHGGGMMGCGW